MINRHLRFIVDHRRLYDLEGLTTNRYVNTKYNDATFKNTSENLSLISLYDLPKQTKLNNTNLCGYIEPDGTYHECGHCEHLSIIRKLILQNYLYEYMIINPEFFDKKPFGMLQEEYFAMKELKWVKISSFELDKDTMYSFTYNTLTPAQTEKIYPR